MAGLDLLTSNGVNKWLVSIYFATTTITTIGYGDVTPQTPAEVAMAICFMVLAVTYFG
jgi:voltage-gated potassium channel Kch